MKCCWTTTSITLLQKARRNNWSELQNNGIKMRYCWGGVEIKGLFIIQSEIVGTRTPLHPKLFEYISFLRGEIFPPPFNGGF